MLKTIIIMTIPVVFMTSLKIAEKREYMYTPRDVTPPNVSIHIQDTNDEILNIDRISFYNPVPAQTDATPEYSSCGPNKEKQIALSRDLFFDENGSKHLCGKKVLIVTDRGEVFEDYIIWDTMNARFSNTVDIMLPHEDYNEAFDLGVTSGVLYIFHD